MKDRASLELLKEQAKILDKPGVVRHLFPIPKSKAILKQKVLNAIMFPLDDVDIEIATVKKSGGKATF